MEKTNKKFICAGKYSVMENRGDLCIQCGEKGYLKNYYLGISTKVKNSLKAADMCKKSCPIGRHVIIALVAGATI